MELIQVVVFRFALIGGVYRGKQLVKIFKGLGVPAAKLAVFTAYVAFVAAIVAAVVTELFGHVPALIGQTLGIVGIIVGAHSSQIGVVDPIAAAGQGAAGQLQFSGEIMGQQADIAVPAAEGDGHRGGLALLYRRGGNAPAGAPHNGGRGGLGAAGHVVGLGGVEHGGQIGRLGRAGVIQTDGGGAIQNGAVRAAALGIFQHDGEGAVGVRLIHHGPVVDQGYLDGHLGHVAGKVQCAAGLDVVLSGRGSAVHRVIVHRGHILQRAGALHRQEGRAGGLVHGDIGDGEGELAGQDLVVVLDADQQGVGGVVQLAALAGVDPEGHQLHILRTVVVDGGDADFLDPLALGEGHVELIGVVLAVLHVQLVEGLRGIALHVVGDLLVQVLLGHIGLAAQGVGAVGDAADGVDAAEVAELQHLVVDLQGGLAVAHVFPSAIGVQGLPLIAVSLYVGLEHSVPIDDLSGFIHRVFRGVLLHYRYAYRRSWGQRRGVLAEGLIGRDGQGILYLDVKVQDAGGVGKAVGAVIQLCDRGGEGQGELGLAPGAAQAVDPDGLSPVALGQCQLTGVEGKGAVGKGLLPGGIDGDLIAVSVYQDEALGRGGVPEYSQGGGDEVGQQDHAQNEADDPRQHFGSGLQGVSLLFLNVGSLPILLFRCLSRPPGTPCGEGRRLDRYSRFPSTGTRRTASGGLPHRRPPPDGAAPGPCNEAAV